MELLAFSLSFLLEKYENTFSFLHPSFVRLLTIHLLQPHETSYSLANPWPHDSVSRIIKSTYTPCSMCPKPPTETQQYLCRVLLHHHKGSQQEAILYILCEDTAFQWPNNYKLGAELWIAAKLHAAMVFCWLYYIALWSFWINCTRVSGLGRKPILTPVLSRFWLPLSPASISTSTFKHFRNFLERLEALVLKWWLHITYYSR